MATDFSYGGKQILSGGPFKPSGKDMPSDARTRVESYADIASIPNPHVGLKITVKVDETNNNKMTDYIVKSLKANSSGIANMAINEVVRYVDYLGVSSSGGGTSAGTGTGLTSEQAQQLQTAYEHSQSNHVTMDEVNAAISNAQLGGGEVDTTSFATDLSLTGSNLQLKNSQGNLIGTSITLPTNSSSEIIKVSELENDSGFINANYVGNKQIVYLTQAQFNALPTKSPECMYVVTDEEDSNSDGTTVNLTNYYTKSETNSTFATKTELNNLKLQLDNKILSLYSGTSLLSSIDLSGLSSSGGGTPVEGYGNIIPSLTTVNIEEGNEITIGITLDNAPTNEQVVNVSVNNSNCTVSPETLTFTSDNYSTSQNIKITGAHLSSVYTDQTSVITLSSLNVNSKLINVTIANIDAKPDAGNSELTRDNLVYYVDMKDQNWTKTNDAKYQLTEDTNTIYDNPIAVQYMENTTGTHLDGNVIENNVLKSNSTNASITGQGNLSYNVSGFDNKKITFEFLGKIPASATEVMVVAEASGSFFIRGNVNKDIGIYLLTSGGNLGYFDFSSSAVDYTQPHLFSVVLDQQDANLVYKLYSDGVEVLSDTLTGKTLNDITVIKILPQARKGFEMGSLRIYNTALTAEQILANYNYEATIERVW